VRIIDAKKRNETEKEFVSSIGADLKFVRGNFEKKTIIYSINVKTANSLMTFNSSGLMPTSLALLSLARAENFKCYRTSKSLVKGVECDVEYI
jgi:hypothetical protein